MTRRSTLGISAAFIGLAAAWPIARRADHGDAPILINAARHDGRLTDLFAFTRGDKLVLALCTNPAIPPGVSEYTFPSDLKLDLNIEIDSPVAFDDPDDLSEFGGTLLDPGNVKEDITFRVRFAGGTPSVQVLDRRRAAAFGSQLDVELFAGLRDDPFIRAPRTGRNVAAVVLEMPLADVLGDQDTILVWATSKVSGLDGAFQELAARSLRNQFPENNTLNMLRPRDHFLALGLRPDVVIYDTSLSASYPNGRELTDDVVDLVGDPRILANDDPFPSINDVPFLTAFPYLAPPQ